MAPGRHCTSVCLGIVWQLLPYLTIRRESVVLIHNFAQLKKGSQPLKTRVRASFRRNLCRSAAEVEQGQFLGHEAWRGCDWQPGRKQSLWGGYGSPRTKQNRMKHQKSSPSYKFIYVNFLTNVIRSTGKVLFEYSSLVFRAWSKNVKEKVY